MVHMPVATPISVCSLMSSFFIHLKSSSVCLLDFFRSEIIPLISAVPSVSGSKSFVNINEEKLC